MNNLLKRNSSYSFTFPDNDASLWVVDFNAEDPWFNYLNWQTQFELSPFLKQKKEGARFPLLFFCSKFLPAKMLLLVEANTASDWAASVSKTWEDLGKVKTQIFLPQGLRRVDFEKYWKPEETQVSFIEDIP